MTDSSIKLGIVGVGKIVKDQHLPAISKNPNLELVATASRNGSVDGVPAYLSIEEMVAATPELEAVALCMPPQYRYDIAQIALENGLHTLLEKPPGATVSEVEHLKQLADAKNLSLFATWHSRHGAAVQEAKQRLSARHWQSVSVNWKENVRKWHPGQDWIWEAGGLGVFDPGINGLSILTEILQTPAYVRSSKLTFPENKAAPIAANLEFLTAGGVPIKLDLDWRQEGDEQWSIAVKTDEGPALLQNGGADLVLDGEELVIDEQNEYESIYDKFVGLMELGKSDVDLTPLKLVADSFMLGDRRIVEAFHD